MFTSFIFGMSIFGLIVGALSAWFFLRYARKHGKKWPWLWAIGGFFVPTIVVFIFIVVRSKLAKPAGGVGAGT